MSLNAGSETSIARPTTDSNFVEEVGYPFKPVDLILPATSIVSDYLIQLLRQTVEKAELLNSIKSYGEGVEAKDLDKMRQILLNSANLTALIPPHFQLRNANKGLFRALEELAKDQDEFESRITDCTIEVATGAGKTNMEAIISAVGLALKGKVLLVCHRVFLAEQLAKEFEKFLPGVKIAFDHSGNAVGQVAHVRDCPDADIVITIDRTLKRKVTEGSFDSTEFGLIIADESHKYGPLLDLLSEQLPPDAALMRFSATPYSLKPEPDALHYKSIVIGDRVWYGKDVADPLYSYKLLQGIEDGVLAGPKMGGFNSKRDFS